MEVGQSLESNEIDMGSNHSSDSHEIEMEMVPSEYMDAISSEFAYDPVRLPVDQDPTQTLYNRKTLETIWETKRQAKNPYTKQWFNAKSALCQRELRQEMEDYLTLHKSPSCRGAKLEVVPEYTEILGKGEMKQYLDILDKSLPKKVTTQTECLTIWKQINLLRLYCQFDSRNIETFRSSNGFRYLNEFIIKISKLLWNNKITTHTKETAWEVCKEISRAIDVIGLKVEDIHDVKSYPNMQSKQILVIEAYVDMIKHAYRNVGYVKIEFLMLRIFCKIFCDMNDESERILGKKSYERIITVTGPYIVTKKLSEDNAEDISSEDLYHGISILQICWIKKSSCFDSPNHSQSLINAIIICIAREINILEETTGVTEGQLEAEEAEAEARYNSEVLEKGLSLVKDILMTEDPWAPNFGRQGLCVVEEIVHMFKHFTREDRTDDETIGPLFCAKKGCKIFECVHSRIAQLALDIYTAISRSVGEEIPGYEVLFIFLK